MKEKRTPGETLREGGGCRRRPKLLTESQRSPRGDSTRGYCDTNGVEGDCPISESTKCQSSRGENWLRTIGTPNAKQTNREKGDVARTCWGSGDEVRKGSSEKAGRGGQGRVRDMRGPADNGRTMQSMRQKAQGIERNREIQ